MATLQELQQKLDNKTFDPSKLTKEQEAAVDIAFKQGQLTGYKNVGEIRKERNLFGHMPNVSVDTSTNVG